MSGVHRDLNPRLRRMLDEVADLLAGAKRDGEHYEKFKDSLVRRYRPDIIAEKRTVDAFFASAEQRREEIVMRRSSGIS